MRARYSSYGCKTGHHSGLSDILQLSALVQAKGTQVFGHLSGGEPLLAVRVMLRIRPISSCRAYADGIAEAHAELDQRVCVGDVLTSACRRLGPYFHRYLTLIRMGISTRRIFQIPGKTLI